MTSGRAERSTARDTLRRAADHAADRLKRLRQQAGVADDDALRSVIAAQATRAEISKRIAEQVATLRQQADGKTDAELADEAAVVDIDTIPGRIEVILHRADEIDSKAKTLAENLFTTRQRLAAICRDPAHPPLLFAYVADNLDGSGRRNTTDILRAILDADVDCTAFAIPLYRPLQPRRDRAGQPAAPGGGGGDGFCQLSRQTR